MGMIINIDKALELRTDYNVLKEPLNKMLSDSQEAWEKKNPIDAIFVRNTITSFQETYVSSIGFDRAFSETADYSVGPIFNTAEGFSATYRTRTFQGGFVITQQALEDRQYGRIKDDANAFVKRWHADIVDYALASLAGGFGAAHSSSAGVEWVGGDGKKTRLILNSADTTDGDINTATKTSLFNKEHYTVKRSSASPIAQANAFYCGISIDGTDALYAQKLADYINQVIVEMENYKDDNGKRAGVLGQKTIVAPNDPHLLGALNTAISMPEFCGMPNPAYQRATIETSPYLLDVKPCYDSGAMGFFIVDKAYNEANHGLELTERIPFTLDVNEEKRPYAIHYDGRQRFDINVASWRGIAYCRIGANNSTYAWDTAANLKAITAVAVGKPVAIVSPVDSTTGSVRTNEDT